MQLIYISLCSVHFIKNVLHSPCVKQNIQIKINPNPYPGQVDKVMDAAQERWSVICAWGARDFLWLHLIFSPNRIEKEKCCTLQASRSPSVCLCLSEARALNDPVVRLQWEREPTSQSLSQSVSSTPSQAKRQGGKRWFSQVHFVMKMETITPTKGKTKSSPLLCHLL